MKVRFNWVEWRDWFLVLAGGSGWVLEISLLWSLQGGQNSLSVASVNQSFHIHQLCKAFNEPSSSGRVWSRSYSDIS